jgi:hypothetical protein
MLLEKGSIPSLPFSIRRSGLEYDLTELAQEVSKKTSVIKEEPRR